MEIFARILVSLALAVASAFKLTDPSSFAQDVSNYQLLPLPWIQTVSYTLPPLELFVSIALWVPSYRQAAWLLSGTMFTLFSVAVGSALARSLDVSCGCFGQALTVSWLHLIINICITLTCLGIYANSICEKD